MRDSHRPWLWGILERLALGLHAPRVPRVLELDMAGPRVRLTFLGRSRSILGFGIHTCLDEHTVPVPHWGCCLTMMHLGSRLDCLAVTVYGCGRVLAQGRGRGLGQRLFLLQKRRRGIRVLCGIITCHFI